ncbi:dihydrofolate reductase [Lentilactobacillus senioris DSM 24302 = JCM 17472]|uniref:Dihydrofolate reductase n=1 Tax=Lentilactobacillus senioris DSM 24302 = JCM 17472 TaxID=1423802 RepID=A0A0R2D081_9LACO|nr:dihydrofolate reductase [Lentilactobacillus senioris]KRM93817.1 dihydrofolate reductase [Lentilactobacillus senioris DSM 24302 = JCM 17472]
MISFIWAEDLNGLIGKNNHLPWRLPADVKYFKDTTMGHPLVSGANTFKSYPGVLPGRQNIVLAQNDDFPEEVTVVHELEQLLTLIKNDPETEYFISGGATVFKQLLPYVDRLYVTTINDTFIGDTFMPVINYSEFELLSKQEFKADTDNPYNYQFEVYQRITNGDE